MRIEEALVAQLRATAAVVAKVATRIYPAKAPQQPTLPCLVYLREGTNREHTQDGGSGLGVVRFTIDCLGRTYAEAREVAHAVREALEGSRGVWGGVGGVQVDGCFIEDEADDYIDELALYVVGLDVRVMHVEFPAS